MLRVFVDDTDEPILSVPVILEEVLGITNERRDRCQCTAGDVVEDYLDQTESPETCLNYAECAWKFGWPGVEYRPEKFYKWADLYDEWLDFPSRGVETAWVGFTSSTG